MLTMRSRQGSARHMGCGGGRGGGKLRHTLSWHLTDLSHLTGALIDPFLKSHQELGPQLWQSLARWTQSNLELRETTAEALRNRLGTC